MSIRKKGERWEVRVSTGGGRRVERRLPPGASKADARALEDSLKRRTVEIAAGRVDYTIAECLTRLKTESQLLKSWEKDRRYRHAVVEELVGHLRLSQMSEAEDAVKKAGFEAGLKPASINQYLAILKRVATRAFKWEWIAHPIVQNIEMVPGAVRRSTMASVPEFRSLLLAADPRIKVPLLLAALTGLRRGELLALHPSNIVDGSVVVESKTTKNTRVRVIPLPEEVSGIASFLPFQIGAPLLRKLWEVARERVGRPDLRWHDLRRCYGTWLLRGGATLQDVRELLGHGDIKTTSIYLASARQDLRAAVGRFPAVLGEGLGKEILGGPQITSEKAA